MFAPSYRKQEYQTRFVKIVLFKIGVILDVKQENVETRQIHDIPMGAYYGNLANHFDSSMDISRMVLIWKTHLVNTVYIRICLDMKTRVTDVRLHLKDFLHSKEITRFIRRKNWICDSMVKGTARETRRKWQRENGKSWNKRPKSQRQ